MTEQEKENYFKYYFKYDIDLISQFNWNYNWKVEDGTIYVTDSKNNVTHYKYPKYYDN